MKLRHLISDLQGKLYIYQTQGNEDPEIDIRGNEGFRLIWDLEKVTIIPSSVDPTLKTF